MMIRNAIDLGGSKTSTRVDQVLRLDSIREIRCIYEIRYLVDMLQKCLITLAFSIISLFVN